ncbi:MAG: phage tail protein [Terracidiphilus sp.]|jgi:phage tail-like protein
MSEFPTNPTRLDPYKNFNFRVKWDGQYIPAITKVFPLIRTTGVVENREGGDPTQPHKSTGLTEFSLVTLERGVTDDPAFENWANLVFQFGAGPGSEMMLDQFRKDISIELYNEAGQLVRAYKVYRCWPTEYQPMSTLDSNGSEVLIERLTLENEGWERDTSVVQAAQT